MASSRLKPSSDPVTTTVSPARVCSTDASRSSSMRRRRRPTGRRCRACHSLPSRSNQSRTDSAMTPPTPSTPDSSSTLAARIAAIDPKCWASARAAVGPDVADRERDEHAPQRLRSWPTRGWRRAWRRWRTAPGRRRRRPRRVGLLGCAGVERDPGDVGVGEPEERRLVGEHPGLEQRHGPLPAQGLDVEGPATGQPREPLGAAATGRSGELGQRMSLSPSLAGASGRAARRALGGHDERPLGAVAQVDDRARGSRG